MWADNEADLDLLGFDFLVDGLVVALTEPRLLPLTVGVLGDWGSGKSSLMRIASSDLSQEAGVDEQSPSGSESERRSRYLTIEFSPWQYEDYEDVKIALMNAVLDALEERLPDSSEEFSRLRTFVNGLKRLGRRVGRTGASAAPAIVPILLQGSMPDATDPALLEIAGAVTTAVSKEIGATFAEPVGDSSAQSTSAEKKPINDIGAFRKEFGSLVAKVPETDAVIVFIDDLDRCLPETIVDTFEAIRLFLNTPKTAYVLALNQLVVESAIDARYPELKKEDGAGIGRDYLEKMLQLKVAIPPLSAPEAETYVNLLFAELHLPGDDFDRVVVKANENRALNGLSVAFNVGIAGEVLSDVPASLVTNLEWAANITPILSSSLRGNPRQLKRFLNNLLLKHRSAARRKVELKLPVLAKLMVLEDQYNSDFQKLFDWQMASQGPAAELQEAEDFARKTGDDQVAPQAKSKSVEPTKKDATSKSSSARAPKDVERQSSPTDTAVWAAKPHIAEWLCLDPPLGSIDLRSYFTYSRDKLSFGVAASRLAPHLQQLLSHVQSDVDANRRDHYPSVSALEPSERAQFMEALLDRVRRNPGGIPLTAVLEIAGLNSDVVQQVCDALRKIPPTSVPPAAGGTAVRRLPRDNPAVSDLLDHWGSSGSNGLKTLVTQAREAQTKKGVRHGNVGR